MYYLPVDFYQESIDLELLVNALNHHLLIDRLVLTPKMREYLLNHIELTTVISSTLLNRSGTAEHLAKKRQLWTYIQQKNPEVFQAIRKTMLSRLTKHSVLPDRKLSNVVYQITKSVYGFN